MEKMMVYGFLGIVLEVLATLFYTFVVAWQERTGLKFIRNVYIVCHMYGAKVKSVIFALLSLALYIQMRETNSNILCLLFTISFLTLNSALLLDTSCASRPMEISTQEMMNQYLLSMIITITYFVLMNLKLVRIAYAAYLLFVSVRYIQKAKGWEVLFTSWENTWEYAYPLIPFFVACIMIIL